MARLSAAQRRALPDSAFAGPNRTFPVNDPNHARAALSLQRFASSQTKARIKKKASRMGVGNSLYEQLKGKRKRRRRAA